VTRIASNAFVASQQYLKEATREMHALADTRRFAGHPEEEEIVDRIRSALRFQIIRLFDTMVMIYEALDLVKSLNTFTEGFNNVEGEVDEIQYHYDDFDWYWSRHISYLSEKLNILAPIVSVPPVMEGQRQIVRNVLRQTPVLLKTLSINPSKELHVQQQLEWILRLSFPDIVKNPPIPKPTKTYKPDLGIDSIETAIEVKFLEDKAHAGTIMGQLYEDMRGYSNAASFTQFFGLIYMTGAHLSQDVVDAEAKAVGVPKNWEIFTVTG
jgi:hypothetical protein